MKKISLDEFTIFLYAQGSPYNKQMTTMELKLSPITERGVLTLSNTAWSQAHLRNEVIASLAKLDVIGKHTANEAARQLGLFSLST